MDAIEQLRSMVGGAAIAAPASASRRTATPKKAGIKLPFTARTTRPTAPPAPTADEEFPLESTGTYGQF